MACGVLKHIVTCKIALLLLVIVCSKASAQEEWHLKKDEDGIQVYTANTANSNFKSIKVVCTVKAGTFGQLVTFLMDVSAQHDWVYNNKSTELIKKISSSEMIFYSEVSVPWPCTNRDYISHITINQPTPQLVTIDAHSEPDLLPEKAGKVRVRVSKAHWDVTKVGNDALKIVYTVTFDPAGAVPAWLTNMFVTKGPMETFEKLRAGVSKPPYANAHVDFIRETPNP